MGFNDVFFGADGGAASHLKQVVINAAGTSTWTVPAGVTVIMVFGRGGAGGGGGAQSTTGGSGGGGVVSFCQRLTVTPAAVLNYTVGAGGTAGGSGQATAGDGAITTLDVLKFNIIGLGGARNGGTPGGVQLKNGGGNGNVTYTAANWFGGGGGVGNASATGAQGDASAYGVGGAGGSGFGGGGGGGDGAGAAGTASGNGANGTNGGGGSGGSSGPTSGGTGSDGQLVIVYL